MFDLYLKIAASQGQLTVQTLILFKILVYVPI